MFVAPVAHAQTPAATAAPSDAPGLQVVKNSWSKERIDWERNPFGGPNENFHEMQFRSRSEARAAAARRSNNPEASKLERDARADAAIIEAERQKKGPPRYAFIYKATFENVSGKAIKEIDWDYVFTDSATQQELDRRQFTSDEKIAPGKKKELYFLIPTPPTQHISIYALNKKESDGLDGHVVIVRILYADGTNWQRP